MSPEEGEEPAGSCPRQVFPDRAWLDEGWAQPLGLAPRTELPVGVRAHRGALDPPSCWLLGTSHVPVFMALLGESHVTTQEQEPRDG